MIIEQYPVARLALLSGGRFRICDDHRPTSDRLGGRRECAVAVPLPDALPEDPRLSGYTTGDQFGKRRRASSTSLTGTTARAPSSPIASSMDTVPTSASMTTSKQLNSREGLP